MENFGVFMITTVIMAIAIAAALLLLYLKFRFTHAEILNKMDNIIKDKQDKTSIQNLRNGLEGDRVKITNSINELAKNLASHKKTCGDSLRIIDRKLDAVIDILNQMKEDQNVKTNAIGFNTECNCEEVNTVVKPKRRTSRKKVAEPTVTESDEK